MIPIRDYIPTRNIAYMTLLLIAVNVVVFAFELLLMAAGSLDVLIYSFGFIPYRITHDFSIFSALTLVTSMFLHGGLFHIFGNMLYLWIFGNNVEDNMGWLGFAVFFFACGIIATLTEVAVSPNSQVPGIGASGAVAGVLGAYLILYPRARVDTLLILGFFFVLRPLPAVFVLLFWFVLQFFNGVASFGMSQTGGVAWFAHIGGFIAGIVLVFLFVPPWRRKHLPMGDATRPLPSRYPRRGPMGPRSPF